jgi:hypothetical protein
MWFLYAFEVGLTVVMPFAFFLCAAGVFLFIVFVQVSFSYSFLRSAIESGRSP